MSRPNLSRSPSKPTTPIKITSEEAKQKILSLKSLIDQLNKELVIVQKQKDEIRKRSTIAKNEFESFVTTVKEENRTFLASLKKAVDKRNATKVTYTTNNPFIKRHQVAIKESLRRKGHAVEEDPKDELDNLRQSQPINQPARSRDPRALNQSSQGVDSHVKSGSRLYSKSTAVSQTNTETDILIEKLQGSTLKSLPSYMRGLGYAKNVNNFN